MTYVRQKKRGGTTFLSKHTAGLKLVVYKNLILMLQPDLLPMTG